MIVGHIDAFGGIIERPFELDVGWICVHVAFDLGLLLLCNAVDALLVGGASGRICAI